MKVAAVSYVSRADGTLLCVWNQRYGGWSMPGGLVEEGETSKDAQARELEEETSLKTVSRSLIFSGPVDPAPADVSRASWVDLYRVEAEGEPREAEPGCRVCWLTPAFFLESSPFREFYAKVFEELGIG